METISRAYISGSLERAYFQQNGAWLSIEEESQSPSYCSKIDIANLLSFGGEIIEISEQTDLDALKQRLALEIDKQKSLSLAIDAISARYSQSIRQESLEVLQLYFDDCIDCYEFVRRRLLSNHDFDPVLIEEAVALSPNYQTKQLYGDLLMYLESIEFLNNTWTITAPAFIEENSDRDDARFFFIDHGVWESFGVAIYQRDTQQFESESVRYAIELAQNKWLQQPIMLFREMKSKLADGEILKLKERAEMPLSQLATEDDPIIKLIQEYLRNKQLFKENKKHKRKNKYINNERILRKVEIAKEKLVKFMPQNQILEFKSELVSLLTMQMDNSEPGHIVKTLTDLASRAIEFENFNLAETLIEYCKLFHIDTSVVKGAHAQILKEQYFYDEAIVLYESIIAEFPTNVFARNGIAGVLKAMGEFDQAFKAYEKSLEIEPSNVFTLNGLADVLKYMGKSNEALEAYNSILTSHPEDIVALSGKADVLKEIGSFAKANVVYDKVLKIEQNSIIALTGKADILKEEGKYKEALKAYEDALVKFPNNRRTLIAKAYLLKAMGNHEEALDLFAKIIKSAPNDKYTKAGWLSTNILLNRTDEIKAEIEQIDIPKIERDWVLYHISAMYYLKIGNLNEAKKRLENGVKRVKDNNILVYYRESLSYTLVKQEQFDKAIDIILTKKLNKKNKRSEIDEILLTHSYAELNNNGKAFIHLHNLDKAKNDRIVKCRNLLSERYSINGYQKSGLPQTQLDEEISELEFELVFA